MLQYIFENSTANINALCMQLVWGHGVLFVCTVYSVQCSEIAGPRQFCFLRRSKFDEPLSGAHFIHKSANFQFKSSPPLQKFTLEEPKLTPTLAAEDYFSICTIFCFLTVNYIRIYVVLL
jgi:hypothetical protein